MAGETIDVGFRFRASGSQLANASNLSRKQIQSLRRELDRTSQTTRTSNDRFQRLSRTMDGLSGVLGPIIGIGGASMFARMGQQAISATARMDELADTANVNVERFQELTKAFSDMAGVSEAETAGALRRFNRRLGLAREGTGAAVKTLDRLNIKLEQDTTSALDEAITKLANMEDGSSRAAAASELFGEDAGPRLAAALGQGGKALDETIEKLREQGRIMDEETAAAARRLNDRYNEIVDTLQTKFRSAVVNSVEGWRDILGLTDGAEFQRIQGELEDLRDRRDEILSDMNRPWLFRTDLLSSGEDFKQELQEINQEMLELQKRLEELRKGSKKGSGDGSPAPGGNTGDNVKNLNIAGNQDYNSTQVRDALLLERNIHLYKELGETQGKVINQRIASQKDYNETQVQDLRLLELRQLEQDGINDKVQTYTERLREQERQQRETKYAADQLGYTMANAFENAVFQADNARDAVRKLIAELARLAFREYVTKTIAGAISDSITGDAAADSGGSGGSGGTAVDTQSGSSPRIPIPDSRAQSGGTLVIQQNITVGGGSGSSQDTQRQVAIAAELGAQRGYSRAMQDMRRNGPLRRQTRR